MLNAINHQDERDAKTKCFTCLDTGFVYKPSRENRNKESNNTEQLASKYTICPHCLKKWQLKPCLERMAELIKDMEGAISKRNKFMLTESELDNDLENILYRCQNILNHIRSVREIDETALV